MLSDNVSVYFINVICGIFCIIYNVRMYKTKPIDLKKKKKKKYTLYIGTAYAQSIAGT